MAEAFLNAFAGDRFEAHSAGLEPGKLNPLVVEVMRESRIDLSENRTKSVEEFLASEPPFDYVVTVCDGASAERCPVFPGPGQRLHWPFADPSGFTGNPEEKLAATRGVRDAIRAQVQEWSADPSNGGKHPAERR